MKVRSNYKGGSGWGFYMVVSFSVKVPVLAQRSAFFQIRPLSWKSRLWAWGVCMYQGIHNIMYAQFELGLEVTRTASPHFQTRRLTSNTATG